MAVGMYRCRREGRSEIRKINRWQNSDVEVDAYKKKLD
jgi:hypothetical protein